MTKDELMQYKHRAKEILNLKEQISRLEAVCEYKSPNHSGMPKAKGGSADLLDRLIDMKKELAQKQWEVEEFISCICDSRVRLIYRYRYIDGLKWDDIADKMCYSRIQVIRLHNGYISGSRQVG